ncbi:HAD hydrolase, subfamily IA and HAD-like domain-containing protein [Strongyloides ratti]|uniref:HAD hydrolase, subfamily IA and HAD-like domain-containing protein n=1 Tax=Strongyloides ratti TaxID=34506 RepID=A0A090KY68_STRRB|nr:HAD hydrolase, subfamily IA and HAD-like domain-containing protein [Strongyloides ratti]CEF60153.1 HAD hydrolase, subfamily IA and HAD-like domain-containing protein [Strongyloides ratti]
MALRSGVLKINSLKRKLFILGEKSLKTGLQYEIPEERREKIYNENIDSSTILCNKNFVKKEYLKKPELIIFDKDGTLICFHAMWVPWVIGYVERIEKFSGLYLSSDLYKKLGFCKKTRKVIPGLLAEGTMRQIKNAVLDVLSIYGMSKEESEKIIKKVSQIMNEEQKNDKFIKEVTNIHRLFNILKNDNIKIAICTSDSRKNTIHTLSFLGVTHFIDFISCGDDIGNIPKPDPSNALKICSYLNVSPSKAIMVGDTLTDLKMAHLAKLGGSVGVLTGVGNYSLLYPYSKLLVNDVSQIPMYFI